MTVAPFAQVLAELGSFGLPGAAADTAGCAQLLTAFCVFTQVFMVLDEAHYCSVTCVRNQTPEPERG